MRLKPAFRNWSRQPLVTPECGRRATRELGHNARYVEGRLFHRVLRRVAVNVRDRMMPIWRRGI
jgi:hypothetical protein